MQGWASPMLLLGCEWVGKQKSELFQGIDGIYKWVCGWRAEKKDEIAEKSFYYCVYSVIMSLCSVVWYISAFPHMPHDLQ